jgi:hypothetical protein
MLLRASLLHLPHFWQWNIIKHITLARAHIAIPHVPSTGSYALQSSMIFIAISVGACNSCTTPSLSLILLIRPSLNYRYTLFFNFLVNTDIMSDKVETSRFLFGVLQQMSTSPLFSRSIQTIYRIFTTVSICGANLLIVVSTPALSVI